MALTKIGTDGIKDDAVTSGKLPANAVGPSQIAQNAVSLDKLEQGNSSNNGKFLRANNGADPTFETVNTDLVSDTSPQLGGLLDGNGNTANFTANNTGLGMPRGTTAQEPTASSYEGYIRYNNDENLMYFSNGSDWLKFNPILAVLSSISGTLFAGATSNLTLTGTGFLSANLVVNFVQSGDSINTNVTVTPSSDTAATVAVPAAVYNNVTAGNAVTIKVTNSDAQTSGTVNKTATSLPTGGTITTYSSGGNNYRVHTFTSSGNFVNTISGLTATYLIVAGGGGAGADSDTGGGGGAGGLLTGTTSPSVNTHAIVVGNGGAGGTTSVSGTNAYHYNLWKRGDQGQNSTAFGNTSIGGGYGIHRVSGVSGGNGGSGGGGGDNGNQAGGSGTSGQGHDGGGNEAMNSNSGNDQGGGGGAGSAGNGRHPGAGVSSSITGTAVVYSKGGTGYHHPDAIVVYNTTNYGWGGRGSNLNTTDGHGANGVVIISYQV